MFISAGSVDQIAWGDGNWAFVDIGFSSKSKSSGLLVGDGEPECVRFNDLSSRILAIAESSATPLNLVVEAPLSVAFTAKGNPKARTVDTDLGKARYWYVGAGSMVLVAATYFVRDLWDSHLPTKLVLYEGFVSYKERGSKSDHRHDVRMLREVVQDPATFASKIVDAGRLKCDETDEVSSAFSVAGMNCGVPPVILRRQE